MQKQYRKCTNCPKAASPLAQLWLGADSAGSAESAGKTKTLRALFSEMILHTPELSPLTPVAPSARRADIVSVCLEHDVYFLNHNGRYSAISTQTSAISSAISSLDSAISTPNSAISFPSSKAAPALTQCQKCQLSTQNFFLEHGQCFSHNLRTVQFEQR